MYFVLRNAGSKLREIDTIPSPTPPKNHKQTKPNKTNPKPPKQKSTNQKSFLSSRRNIALLWCLLSHTSVPMTVGAEETIFHVMLTAVEIEDDPRDLLISLARSCPRYLCTTPSMVLNVCYWPWGGCEWTWAALLNFPSTARDAPPVK